VATPNVRTNIRRFAFPVLAAVGALGLAVLGALLTRGQIGGVVHGVESIAAATANFLNQVRTLLPVGFAFGAGMVAAANPCGFAMLPVYLGLYVGADKPERSQGFLGSLGQAFLVAGAMTAGFVLLFGLAGLLFSFGAQSLVGVFPWIGLGVGVALVLVAAWMFAGGTLYTYYGEQVASKLGDHRQTSVKGYFVFGLSYAIASLSCTLPPFLLVVSSSVATGSLLNAVLQFVMYALGMGAVILALTLSVALFKGTMVRWVRRALPYIQPISAALMLLGGAYLVYYWLTIGGLLA
jgi:cytochrome c biogenesis protein CcdA